MTGRGLALVRRTAPDAETIYQLYVLDERRRLVGTLSLRELILNSPASSVRALMTSWCRPRWICPRKRWRALSAATTC
ncbi:CBS domain-containing protein [Zobellella denitrificans]